jgi:outer membrane biosynthesis protein TonB
MRVGLTVSTLLHGALLGFGLFALSAPQAMEVADVEAFPVDIVPVESITQIQQGEREAPAAEKAAPTPTVRPEPVPEARNAGDNEVDLESAPEAEASPREVKTAATPEPQPVPKPAKPAEETRQQPENEPAPVPATEVTPKAQPRQEVTPEAAEETAVAENPQAEAVKLPENAPSPQARPEPPQAQTAKAPERRDAEKPAEPVATRAPSEKSDFDLDEVAALLNQEKAKGGGAERSTEQAALGGERTTTGVELTQSEMDALRGQIQRCWNVPAGALEAENLKVSVQFRLDRSGALEGTPQIVEGGNGGTVERAAAESARRAVLQCAPYSLPTEKYEAWADVLVHFDPSDMF